MQPAEIEQLGRRVVPGTGSLVVEHLSSGLVSEVYRVVRGGATYALKVASEHAGRFGLDPVWEAGILQAAARAQIAPPLEYFDPERRVLVTRWIHGRSWPRRELQSAGGIARIGGLLRRVHALPIPAPAQILNPMTWIEIYRAALSRGGQMRLDPALQETAALAAAELDTLPKAPGVVCHSDLHTQNLVDSDAGLLLLDWEYAHVTDPLWDAAGWSANNDFDGASQRMLLAGYLGGAPTANDWARFGLLGWLYDYVCLLWSGIYLAARPDPSGLVGARARQLDARLRIPAHYRA
jgi:aminoglycoside phosphotransferase (APT) family kinase protein